MRPRLLLAGFASLAHSLPAKEHRHDALMTDQKFAEMFGEGASPTSSRAAAARQGAGALGEKSPTLRPASLVQRPADCPSYTGLTNQPEDDAINNWCKNICEKDPVHSCPREKCICITDAPERIDAKDQKCDPSCTDVQPDTGTCETWKSMCVKRIEDGSGYCHATCGVCIPCADEAIELGRCMKSHGGPIATLADASAASPT